MTPQNKRLYDFLTDSKNSGSQPKIIAELSGNHNKSLKKALNLVDAAAECGADAIKLQTYTPDTITLNSSNKDFIVKNKKSIWYKKSLYSLYQEAYTPWSWLEKITIHAEQNGLAWFSSPFDDSAVDFLQSFDPPCYKIASPELIDIPLIKKCASTGKPLIMSTGMASISEIDMAYSVAKDAGCKNIVLLKCTSAYPSYPKDANVITIPNLSKTFNCRVGFSDHSPGIGASLAAISMGANIIEKHFVMDRSEGGPDSLFSLEPNEMQSLVIEGKRAWQAIGEVKYGPVENEVPNLQGRRSLYIVRDVVKGEKISSENVKSIRPGYGIAPSNLEYIQNYTFVQDFKKGTALSWKHIISGDYSE